MCRISTETKLGVIVDCFPIIRFVGVQDMWLQLKFCIFLYGWGTTHLEFLVELQGGTRRDAVDDLSPQDGMRKPGGLDHLP